MKNHEECINAVRKQIMENQPNIKGISFEYSNIVEFKNNGKIGRYKKTGQGISVRYEHKKKDGTVTEKYRKSFVGHTYCPFCGKKY